MHRTLLAITLLIVLFSLYLVGSEVFYKGGRNVLGIKAGKSETNSYTEQAANIFSELKEYPYVPPESVSLQNKIFKVEKIGLKNDGELQAPSSWETTGWYTRSAKPGQMGAIIIDGHYDTDTASPAAFWVLKSAKLNDKVSIKDELGRDFTYRVVNIFFVDIQDPQRIQVFQESGKAELILITCGGVWNEKEGTYNKRLVVKAELVSPN